MPTGFNQPPSSQQAGDKRPVHIMLVDDAGLSIYGTLRKSWQKISLPGTNQQATATMPSPGSTKRLVCLGLTVTFVGGAAAPSATTQQINLIDGSSGGTTYLWRTTLGIPAVAGATNGVARTGWWMGTPGQPMTLEFASNGGANTVESVSFEGTIVDDVVS